MSNRVVRCLALALCLSLGLHAAEAGNELAEAKKLLRSKSADDRREGVRRLVAIDSRAAVPPMEDAIRRSLKSMDKMAKEVDKADEELGKALGFAHYVSQRDPSLLKYAMDDVRKARKVWDALALEMSTVSFERSFHGSSVNTSIQVRSIECSAACSGMRSRRRTSWPRPACRSS